MKLRHLRTLAGQGERTDQFRVRLAGVAVDDKDNLLAVGDHEVKRFSPDGLLELNFPTRDAGWSVAADGDSIWVGMQGAIERYDREGKFIAVIEDTNRLGIITSIGAKGSRLIAADSTHRTIHLYENGVWKAEVGQDVNSRGFMIPNGVLDLALAADGESFIVAHSQKHRVERYSFAGELVAKFGRFGMEQPGDFGGCCNPTNIVALNATTFVVSEKAPPKLKVYSSDGQFQSQFVGVFAANTKNIDLAADSRGRIYATDPARCSIEQFEQVASNGLSE